MKKTSYQAVVVSSSDDDDEKDGLMAYHQDKWTDHQYQQSFPMNPISDSGEEEDDLDVARAREELDGLKRPSRPFNPLTIIQVKNAERNLDDGKSSCWSYRGYHHRRQKRRFVLTVSLITGLGLIGLSAWAKLPSSDPQECQVQPLQNRLRRGTYWTKSYDNITLTSGLEVIEEAEIVVSGFSNRPKEFGLLALRPTDGAEVWRRRLAGQPRKHDCNLVDLNGDGKKDCLVIGEGGLLTAIDPYSGAEIWYMRYHMPLTNISLPRQLPDLDGDRISELVAACAVTFPSEMTDNHVHVRTNFILISGRHGTLMGRPYLVETCTDIGAINVTSSLAIQFDCTSHLGADQFEMGLDEFYSKATNQPSKDFALSVLRADKYRQFSVIGEDPPQTVKDSIHLDWSPLKAHCAECGVTVKMWDSFAHRPLWHRTWPRAVAFQPLSTRFETERADSPIEGFIFRLWQWEPEVGDTFLFGKPEPQQPDVTSTLSTSTSKPLSSENEPEEEEEESILKLYANNDQFETQSDDNPVQYTPPYEVVISNLLPFGRPNLRALLSYETKNTLKKKELKKLRLNVTETIYYATLNHSSPQVIALFQHNLSQECVQKPPFQAYQCVPHYDTMPNSMVIVEKSADGPDWRDVVFVTHSLEKRLKTSIHRLKLSKDIGRLQ